MAVSRFVRPADHNSGGEWFPFRFPAVLCSCRYTGKPFTRRFEKRLRVIILHVRARETMRVKSETVDTFVPGRFARQSIVANRLLSMRNARARLSFLTSPTADAFSARPFLSTISAATKKNPANNGRFPANHCAGERSRVSFRDYNNNYFARVQYARVPTCARRAHNTVPERRRRIGMEKKKLKKIRFPSRRFLDRTVRNILKCASILRCLN